ncbi:MAG: hypothetical protein IJU40_04885, partial [Desulfovibrionaceae bacterium]|nr:hypothetical protein [Desulfovibrionaceae bacterium]
MRISRYLRALICLILGVLIASLGIYFSSQHFMRQGFAKAHQKELNTMRNVVDDILLNSQKRLSQEAKLLSDSRNLEVALVAQDYANMAKFAKDAMEHCKANFATIVDKEGQVLARGHSSLRNDNISSSPLIKSALQ